MIININSAFAYVITYDLNGGALPTGETEFSIESTNDETVLANPIRTGHTFAGWCEKNDYESDGVCDSPKCIENDVATWTIPCTGDTIQDDTDYIALWNAVEVTCPSFESSTFVGRDWLLVDYITRGKYDFDGNGIDSVDECYYGLFTINVDDIDAAISEMERCIYRLRHAGMSEQEFNATYEGDYDYNYFFGTPCNYALLGAKWMICRYNANTSGYTDCGKEIVACDDTGLLKIMSIEGMGATQALLDYVSEQGKTVDTFEWDQDLTNMSDMNDWGVYEECNFDGFTCDVPDIWLDVLNEQMCLIDIDVNTTVPELALIARKNSSKYYVNLVEKTDLDNPVPIHKNSTINVKIKAFDKTQNKNTLYYVHDASVSDE